MRWQGRHIAVVLVLGVAAAVLVGREIGLRMWGRLEALDAAIAEETQALEDARQRVQAEDVYRQRWEAIRGFRDEAVTERQQEFSGYLSQVEKASGVLIRSQGPFSGRPLGEASGCQALSCTLNISCDLESLASFLGALDEEPGWLLRVESLSVRSQLLGGYGSARYIAELAPTETNDLVVDMTLSIPAAVAKPAGEGAVRTMGGGV